MSAGRPKPLQQYEQTLGSEPELKPKTIECLTSHFIHYIRRKQNHTTTQLQGKEHVQGSYIMEMGKYGTCTQPDVIVINNNNIIICTEMLQYYKIASDK